MYILIHWHLEVGLIVGVEQMCSNAGSGIKVVGTCVFIISNSFLFLLLA